MEENNFQGEFAHRLLISVKQIFSAYTPLRMGDIFKVS